MLIHPDDEVPTFCPVQGAVSHYQHGQVRFNKCRGMSVGFVFRSTTSMARFDRKTNLWIKKQEDIVVPRQMYNDVDISKFQQSMISNLEAIIGSN